VNKFYDRDGRPIDLMAWAAKFEDRDYKIVRQDNRDDFKVSTVWLGSDHRWGPGAPLIFETMVFGGENDQAQYRYCTEAAARSGHAVILAACEAREPLPEALPEGDAPSQPGDGERGNG
jgi:hypothetical protein